MDLKAIIESDARYRNVLHAIIDTPYTDSSVESRVLKTVYLVNPEEEKAIREQL